jgi:hypothetical protein
LKTRDYLLLSQPVQRFPAPDDAIKILDLENGCRLRLPQRSNHRAKINSAFSYCAVGIFSAVVVMNVHVGEAGFQEFGQAMVEIRVAAIKGKAGGSNEPDIFGGPQVEEIHVPHILKPEREREIG